MNLRVEELVWIVLAMVATLKSDDVDVAKANAARLEQIHQLRNSITRL